jgi:hypothetical protein
MGLLEARNTGVIISEAGQPSYIRQQGVRSSPGERGTQAFTPICMTSAPGFDISYF